MKIKYCTITGADDQVDPEDLVSLSYRYPFVEWGILFSLDREKTSRYPSERWVYDFLDAAENYMIDINRSAHLCGYYAEQFVKCDPKIFSLLNHFQRVQLNINFRKSKIDPDSIHMQIQFAGTRPVITQYNEDNKWAWCSFKDLPNHEVLYDGSGGRGIVGDWIPPLPLVTCGYAGGLTPDNLADELEKIGQVAGDHEIWIDMESGVRTDNQLDLEKVERVLQIVGASL